MPSQRVILRAKGLYSRPGPMTDAPDGALLQADDVVIDRDGVVGPRRGFSQLAGTVAGAINRISSYQDTLLLHHSNTTLVYRNGSSWTALSGTYAAPDSSTAKIRFAEAAKNLYFTTSSGVYRLDAYSGTPGLAGVTKPPGFDKDLRVATANAGGLVRTGGATVTVTTTAAHGFYVGQVVAMTSAGEANFANGNKTVVTVPSSTSFTYSEAGTNTSSGSSKTFGTAAVAASGGILADGYEVAYRQTFVMRDANGNEFESAPSQRFIVSNASGTRGWVTTESKNVVLRVLLPSGVTTSHEVRVHRSRQVAVSATSEPSDDMGLVYSRRPTLTETTQGWMDVTDIAPDALIGATLYASPLQDGLAQSNERPPLAKDVALYGGSLWFSNTRGPHRFQFSILGVGGTTGLQNGDQLIFSEDSNGSYLDWYTATTSTPSAANDFYLDTSGSASQNIRNTSLSLCAAINRSSADAFFAYYLSGADDAPGRIVVEARTLANSTYYPHHLPATANDSSSALAPRFTTSQVFNLARSGSTVTATVVAGVHFFVAGQQVKLTANSVAFPSGVKTIVSATTTTFTYSEAGSASSESSKWFDSYPMVSTSADAAPNRLYYSRTNQPEAVPLLNYIDVGSKDAEILRIVATRSSLFVFKEDGLFRVNGGNGIFEVQLFDPTVHLLAPDSAVALENQVYALADIGVVAVSDTGVDIISRNVEELITSLRGASLTNLKNLTFGVAYPSERKYLLWTISASGDTTPTQAFVYNTLTQAWTRWPLSRTHGYVNPADDKLHLAEVSGYYVSQERKDFAYSDFSDRSVSVTVGSVAGAFLTLSGSPDVAVGDIIKQGSYWDTVSGVTTGGGNTVVSLLEDTHGANVDSYYAIGAATVYKAIPSVVAWAGMVGDGPGKLKTWQDTEFVFANAWVPRLTYTVSSELATAASSTVQLFTQTQSGGAKGSINQWTNPPTTWPGTESPGVARVFVPQAYRMADRLFVKVAVPTAWGVWSLDALTQLFNPGSSRPAR